MCQGVAMFANNKKALYGKKSNSHTTSTSQLRIDEDKYRKFEYLWWDKKVQHVHYDNLAEDLLRSIDIEKATDLVNKLVKKELSSQDQLVNWLKNVPDEWDKLLDPKFKTLARKVNPKLILYQGKLVKFKKTPIEKYNPYQATKLPKMEEIKKKLPIKVGNQVWNQVWDQVGNQVWNQVWDQVGNQVWNQVRNQVGDQVWNQVGNQEYATSYWGVKIALNLPIKHWFFDFLKLGIMIVFVSGKAKMFGKKGKYLGEYDMKDF